MRFLQTLFFGLVSTILFSQGGLIKSTDQYNLVTKSFVSSELSIFESYQAGNGDLIVISKLGKSFKYFLFDKELELVANFEHKHEKGNFLPDSYLETSMGRFFIEKRFDRKSKTWNIYGAKDEQVALGEAKLLFKHPYDDKSKLIKITAFRSNLMSLYDNVGALKISNNKDHVGYVNTLKLTKGKEYQSLQLAMFDSALELKWSKEIEIEEPSKKVVLQNYLIGNNGAVYLLFRKKNARNGGLTYFFYKVDEEKATRIDLESPALNCQMSLLRGNTLALLGYYSERKNDNRKFFRLYDQNLSMSKDLRLSRAENLSTILPKTIFGIFRDNKIQEVYSTKIGQHEDGSIQVVDQEIRYTIDGGYFYGLELGDFVVYTLNEDFELENIDVVDKRFSVPALYNATVVNFIGDQLFLLYVDKKRANTIFASAFNKGGMLAGEAKEIDIKFIKNKPSLEGSFIHNNQLYLLSKSGTQGITTKFQFHLLDLAKE